MGSGYGLENYFVTPAIVEIPMTFYCLTVSTVTTVSKFDIDEQSFSCNQKHAKHIAMQTVSRITDNIYTGNMNEHNAYYVHRITI